MVILVLYGDIVLWRYWCCVVILALCGDIGIVWRCWCCMVILVLYGDIGVVW